MIYLLDTDFIFAYLVPTDSNHQKAVDISKQLTTDTKIYISNLVIYETATVLSYKIDQKTSLRFLNEFLKPEHEKIWFTPELESETVKLFQKQVKRGTSFVDCSNVIIKKVLNIDQILSFDEFYQKL